MRVLAAMRRLECECDDVVFAAVADCDASGACTLSTRLTLPAEVGVVDADGVLVEMDSLRYDAGLTVALVVSAVVANEKAGSGCCCSMVLNDGFRCRLGELGGDCSKLSGATLLMVQPCRMEVGCVEGLPTRDVVFAARLECSIGMCGRTKSLLGVLCAGASNSELPNKLPAERRLAESTSLLLSMLSFMPRGDLCFIATASLLVLSAAVPFRLSFSLLLL